MYCSSCGFENREGMKFCGQCSTLLKIRCPNCSYENPSEFKFCGACGTALTKQPEQQPDPATRSESPAAGREAPKAERRQLTVMFCDLVGSTALSEQLDPEELREVIRAYQAVCAKAISRFDGYLARYLGDGVLVYFGYPQAHEDDAQRAVRTGLEILSMMDGLNQHLQRDWEVELAVRLGIHTGLVVVGEMGGGDWLSTDIIGRTPNIAARLEGVAPPNGVVISPDTYRLVEGFFDCQSLGLHPLKGISNPMEVYQVRHETGVQSRLEVAESSVAGLTPYVGREQELGVLKEYFGRVKNGQGQVVFISGEAGIGKSRLLLEFRRSIEAEAGTWLEGQCISIGQHTPYLPLLDVLKHAFRVEEDDDKDHIVQRVQAGTADWEEPLQATVPYLKYLLNVDPGDSAITTMDPRMRRAGILDGLQALLLAESRRQPLVLAVEDLHWIDEQSETAVATLVDVIPSVSVLLLLSYRPEYSHSLGERTYLSHLTLADLQLEERTALAQAVLQVADLPQELEQLIASKGEGNPFYIEEVTKSLLETGVLRKHKGTYELARPAEKIQVPNTIQGVILSRLDRLEQDPRTALQLASVIGREFTMQLLAHISDLEAQLEGVLEALKGLELIYQKAYFPELAYMFKHALTQDVTYSTLLRARRRALHRLIGAAIEDLYMDRLTEQYETLAYHYFEGEAWNKALDYLVKSGEKATSAFANQDALDYYARTLEVCEKLGDSALGTSVEIARRRGMVKMTIGDLRGAIAEFDRMLTAARNLEDQHLEGMALAYRGWAEWQNSDLATAEMTLSGVLDTASEAFEDVRFFASVMLRQTFLVSNRHAEAGQLLQIAEELASRVDNPFMQVWWNFGGASWLNWEGRFQEALDFIAGRRVTPEKNSVVFLANSWFEALTLGGKGEYEQALALFKAIIAIGERIGDIFWRVRALNAIGWIYGELQDYQQAIVWNTQSLEEVQVANIARYEVESNARLNLGDNLLLLGRSDEAEAHFQRIEQIVRAQSMRAWMLWRYSQRLFHSYGELWLLRGDPDKALSYADECLVLAEESNSRKNIVKGRRLRGQAFLARDKLAKAERELAIALDVAQQIGNPPQLWKTYAALGDLGQAQGKPDEAHHFYTKALTEIATVAANLSNQSLQDTMLNSAQVQEIRTKRGDSQELG